MSLDGHAEIETRVIVAGMGAITALGTSVEALWQGVKAGRVAIQPVQRLPMASYRTRLGAEILESLSSHKTRTLLPMMHSSYDESKDERAIDFAVHAGEEALHACAAGVQSIPGERWGVVIGTCMGGISSGSRWYKDYRAGKRSQVQRLLHFTPQGIAEAVSSVFGFRGPVISLSTACAAGANAIGYAADLIRNAHADAVLTGGTDTLSDVTFAGFHALESLSPEPAAPYSRNRQGLSLGEGSGMLVLMRADIAYRLGISPLAEVSGYGLSADGYHPTAPDPQGKGAQRAIQAALNNAGVRADQIQYVNGHGTGTAKNDVAETRAIHLALGPAANQVVVSSTKSMIGHLLGAAGAVEGIVTIKALQEQLAPPTANFGQSDPECNLDYAPNTARPLPIEVAISNNFAFGGNNACLILGKNALGEGNIRSLEPAHERVVVTGLAMLTSAGNTVNEVWEAFNTGRSGIQVERGRRVGRVPHLYLERFLTARERRRMDRLSIFSVVTAQMALEDATLAVTDANRQHIGILFGSALGPMESLENFCAPLFAEGTAAASPGIFPNTVFNAAAGQVAMHVGIVGPTSTVTTGHGAGLSALCYGYDLVATGRAEAMVCLAADTLTETIIESYCDLGILSPQSCFALAEGSVALVLERLAGAQARGVPVYGEIKGYGIASDARGIGCSDPRGDGVERAIRAALKNARINPDEISAVWANLSGFRPTDLAETRALHHIFKQTHNSPQIQTPKKLFGDAAGAGGLLNAALAVKSWQDQPRQQRDAEKNVYALVNSSTLGGTHFSLVLQQLQGEGGNV